MMKFDNRRRDELVSQITESVINQLNKRYGPQGVQRFSEISRRKAKPLTESEQRLRALRRRGLYPLTEASINRILSHGEHGLIIISGNRSEIESSDPNLDLTEQCSTELAFVVKTLLGEPLTDEDKKAVQYDGFDYRSKALANILSNNVSTTDVESAINDPDIRQRWLDIRNKWADKALQEDIKKAGYAWSKVFGGYHGGDNVVDSYEPSFIVYNHGRGGGQDYGDWDRMYDFAVEMCKKYGQGSVYVQAPDEAPVYVNGDGQVVSKSSTKNFKINRDNEEFFTTNKRRKKSPQRFTGDIHFESIFRGHGPSDYTDRVRRRQSGEVFLD